MEREKELQKKYPSFKLTNIYIFLYIPDVPHFLGPHDTTPQSSHFAISASRQFKGLPAKPCNQTNNQRYIRHFSKTGILHNLCYDIYWLQINLTVQASAPRSPAHIIVPVTTRLNLLYLVVHCSVSQTLTLTSWSTELVGTL